MKTTKYALAAALGFIALVAPRTIRADSYAAFDMSGIMKTSWGNPELYGIA